jgi:hypothetical protein
MITTGALQIIAEHTPDPEGATGYHRMTLRVDA